MNTTVVTYDLVKELIDTGIEYEVFEGSLLDNYIFYGDGNINIEGIVPAKFIIIIEKFVNTWTSKLELITTDDINVVNEYEEFLSREI